MRSNCSGASALAVGLFGDQTNTSLVLSSARASSAASSSAKPCSASSCIARTSAPWMRAATPYVPKVGGQHDDVVEPGATEHAQQQVDGFVAAATDQHLFGAHAIQPRQALHQRRRLRLGVTVEAGRRAIAFNAPWQLVGMQAFQRWFPSRVAVGRQGADIARGRAATTAAAEVPLMIAHPSIQAGWSRREHAHPGPPAWPVFLLPGQAASSPSLVSSCTVTRFWKSVSDRPL